MSCFIATAFQLCSTISHLEGSGNQEGLQSNGTHPLLIYTDDQLAGQNHNIRTGNKSSEIVEQFKYLGTNVRINIAFMKKLRAD